MDIVLYNWLKKEFEFNNHKKYHKYFQEWVNNLSETQIFYFEKQRLSVINKTMVQH